MKVRAKKRKLPIIEAICEDCSSTWAYHKGHVTKCDLCGGEMKVLKIVVR